MDLLPISDITRTDAITALSWHRKVRYGVEDQPEVLHKVSPRRNSEIGIRSHWRTIGISRESCE
jgi:hypothetical protein